MRTPGRPGGKSVVIVATEQNLVYALDAATGMEVWQTQVVGDPKDTPVPRAQMLCGGEIDPFGITGTPVIDAKTGTLFLDAMTTSDGGATKKHKIFALSIDDGSRRPGFPVDTTTLKSGSTPFLSQYQGQRGALALVGSTLYVPYGGLAGDCGTYHGWVIALVVLLTASYSTNPLTAIRVHATVEATPAGNWTVNNLGLAHAKTVGGLFPAHSIYKDPRISPLIAQIISGPSEHCAGVLERSGR